MSREQRLRAAINASRIFQMDWKRSTALKEGLNSSEDKDLVSKTLLCLSTTAHIELMRGSANRYGSRLTQSLGTDWFLNEFDASIDDAAKAGHLTNVYEWLALKS